MRQCPSTPVRPVFQQRCPPGAPAFTEPSVLAATTLCLLLKALPGDIHSQENACPGFPILRLLAARALPLQILEEEMMPWKTDFKIPLGS